LSYTSPIGGLAELNVDEIREVARLYRRLVLLIGAQLVLIFGASALGAVTGSLHLTREVAAICNLLLSIALVVTTLKLMEGLDADGPILWAIGMFVPLLSIVVLLMISSKATAWCRERGISVGLLGPTKKSLDSLGALSREAS
jgi:hypothetical protein